MLPTASAADRRRGRHLPRALAQPPPRSTWPTACPAPGAAVRQPRAGRGLPAAILAEAEAAGSGREAQIEAARRAFYEGFVAEAIAGYLATAEVMDITGSATAAC